MPLTQFTVFLAALLWIIQLPVLAGSALAVAALMGLIEAASLLAQRPVAHIKSSPPSTGTAANTGQPIVEAPALASSTPVFGLQDDLLDDMPIEDEPEFGRPESSAQNAKAAVRPVCRAPAESNKGPEVKVTAVPLAPRMLDAISASYEGASRGSPDDSSLPAAFDQAPPPSVRPEPSSTEPPCMPPGYEAALLAEEPRCTFEPMNV